MTLNRSIFEPVVFLMDNKYIDHRNARSCKVTTIDKVGNEEKRGQQNRLVAVPASPIVA